MSLNILQNVKLAPLTSWLIGGEAEFFCKPKNRDELREALLWFSQNAFLLKNKNYTVLGGGSNVLISDQGIQGLTICLQDFVDLKTEIKNDRLMINCLAGTPKTDLLKIFLKYQLAPAMFLAGLPGDVGGGVVMNAGIAEMSEPREFMQIVDQITVMKIDGTIETLQKNELQIKYRHTDGWQPHIVVSVDISWPLVKNENILQQVREANKLRASKQPLDKPSCGSVFKNPEAHKAAQLIDQCSLKGFQIGEAQVSTKHANFIVNLGSASAVDTWNLILHVQDQVLKSTGIKLETEVVRLGLW